VSEGTPARADEPARVLVVEDDDAFAALLALRLGADDRFEVVGRARDGAEGVSLANELRPDVVLMDIEMPVMDGVEATRRILSRRPSARILAVSGSDYAERALEMRHAGAYDYVRKNRLDEDLVRTILAALPR
jgi:DNA-binding NarL/FixJ family response regulator